jgi:hypothetical protein
VFLSQNIAARQFPQEVEPQLRILIRNHLHLPSAPWVQRRRSSKEGGSKPVIVTTKKRLTEEKEASLEGAGEGLRK